MKYNRAFKKNKKWISLLAVIIAVVLSATVVSKMQFSVFSGTQISCDGIFGQSDVSCSYSIPSNKCENYIGGITLQVGSPKTATELNQLYSVVNIQDSITHDVVLVQGQGGPQLGVEPPQSCYTDPKSYCSSNLWWQGTGPCLAGNSIQSASGVLKFTLKTTTPPVGSVCVPMWTCDAWGDCQGGIQSRNCADQNGCGQTASQDLLIQNCVESPPVTGNIVNLPTTGETAMSWPDSSNWVLLIFLGVAGTMLFVLLYIQRKR